MPSSPACASDSAIVHWSNSRPQSLGRTTAPASIMPLASKRKISQTGPSAPCQFAYKNRGTRRSPNEVVTENKKAPVETAGALHELQQTAGCKIHVGTAALGCPAAQGYRAARPSRPLAVHRTARAAAS